MPKEYMTKNRIEAEKNFVEKEKNLISKVDTLRIVLEANKPDGSGSYSEYNKYTTIWADDEEQEIKDKLLELIKQF